MLRTREAVLARLEGMGIATTTHRHPPVFTVEEAHAHTGHLPGGHCKNLFLKDKKGRLWLVTCRDDRRLDLTALAKVLGAARLSFGRADLLEGVLGVTPGSVTPLAIVNDTAGQVTMVLDAALMAQDTINCHPLENDATVTIASADLVRFLAATGHEPVMLDLSLIDAANA